MNVRGLWNILVATLLLATSLSAQSPLAHTYVSSSGRDTNPCNITAPCLTFQGALANTAAGGIISALTPGDFGAIGITQPVTIDGIPGASIVTTGEDAVLISTGELGGLVTLRNLTIVSSPTQGGNYGVYVGNPVAIALVIENCEIENFLIAGIAFGSGAGTNIVVTNTTISDNPVGVETLGLTTNNQIDIELRNVSLLANGTGVLNNQGVIDISDSIVTGGNIGLQAEGNNTINAENNMITFNGEGVEADSGSTIRLSNNDLFNNLTAIASAGGTVATAGNNKKGGSANTSMKPNASVTVE